MTEAPTWGELEAEDTPTWSALEQQDKDSQSQIGNAGKLMASAVLSLSMPSMLSGKELTDPQRDHMDKQPFMNVVRAFGQGYKESLEFDQETEADLKKYGQYKPLLDMHDVANKSLMDGTIVPLGKNMWHNWNAMGANLTVAAEKAVVGATMAPFHALEEAAMAAGKEIQGEEFNTIGRNIRAGIQYTGMMTPEALHVPSLPRDVAVAKASGVLESEGVYNGTVPPTPAQRQKMFEAADMYPDAHEAYYGTEPPAKAPDIGVRKTVDEHARTVDPEAFDQRDRLTHRVDTLKRWYNDFKAKHEEALDAQSPFSEELAAARDKLENGSPKNKKVYAGRVEALEKKHAEWLAEQPHSGDMQKTWSELQKAQGELYDLAYSGRIAKAYREADALVEKPIESELVTFPEPVIERAPEPVVTPDASALIKAETVPETMTPEVVKIAKENKIPVTEATTPAQIIEGLKEKVSTDLGKTIEQQKAEIMDHVKEQLIKVDRGVEEAEEAAKLVAAHYEARAERFEGKRGTALEMYNADSPRIRAGQMRAVKAAKAAKPTKLDKQPILQWMIKRGGISPESPLGQGLKNMDISPGKKGTPPKLFNKNSAKEFDNIPASEFNDQFDVTAVEDGNGYVDPNWLAEQIKEESAGRKLGKEYEREKEMAQGHENDARFQEIKDEVTKVAKEMKVEGLTEREIEAIADELGKDLSVATEDVIASYIEREAIKEFNQSANGKIRLASDKTKALITIFERADPSTFIHETGHHWLDELVKDAEHADAPEELKADAKAAREWAGLTTAEPKTKAEEHAFRKAHEKWARGVERYLMEGVAPTKELSGVFAKYKKWLTRIYQIVENLRAPITPEIRAVFDRLLTTKPERTVIAEEHAPGKMMADIHEIDARDAVPETYIQTADIMYEERDALLKQRLEEYANAVIPAETGESLEALSELGPVDRPAAGGNVAGPEPQAVYESGNKPAPESHRARKDEPVGAYTDLGPPPSEYVDKAGNIRLDNLNAGWEVKQVLRDAAAHSDDFSAARGGVIPDTVRRDAAQSLGLDPKNFDMKQPEGVSASVWADAVQRLTFQQAERVAAASKKFGETGDVDDAMEWTQEKQRFQMIAEYFSTITAEAGRTLRVFDKGKIEFTQSVESALQDTNGMDLYQMQQAAKKLGQINTQVGRARFMKDMQKANFFDKMQEYWINALLSGPITHVKNIIGNTVVAINDIHETAIAAGVSKVLRSEDPVYLSEVKARAYGSIQGLQEGFQVAGKIIADEDALTRFQTAENVYSRAIEGVKGEVIRVPTRLLNVEDQVFKSIAYRAELNAQAYRAAEKEGLTGDAFNQRVAELTQNPTEAAMEKAIEAAKAEGLAGEEAAARAAELSEQEIADIKKRAGEQANREGLTGDAFYKRVTELAEGANKEEAMAKAQYQTFQNKLGKMGSAVQNLANSHPLVKILVIPFVKTPINILKYANERSITGLMAKEIRDNIMGRNGTRKRDIQIARMINGSVIAAYTMYQAAQGNITGAAPKDPAERAKKYLTGWRPYSIKIGDNYYSYNWVEPFSTIMGISADIVQAADEETMEKAAVAMIGAVATDITDKSYLRGVSNFAGMASNPDRLMETYAKNLAGSMVPAAVNQATKALDPQMREARTIIDTAKSRVYGLADDLRPKRDLWGQPMQRDEAAGPDILSPIYTARMSKDPVNIALAQLPWSPAMPDKKIRGVETTPAQYDDLCRIAGTMAKQQLNGVVQNPAFQNAPVEMRLKVFKKIVDSARDKARMAVMLKSQNNPDKINYPDIAKQATINKNRRLEPAKEP